jgi:hypothetical protein
MADIAGRDPMSSEMGMAQALRFGKERTDAMLNVQKEILEECEEAGRVWIARVKSEVELWSDLGTKLSASHTLPEGMDAYRDCISQRMKMAAEDGKMLFEEGQKFIGTVSKSLAKDWPTAKTK